MTTWEPVLPAVWRFRDSCNVYAVEGPGGTLLIDAGTGHWLAHVRELPAPPSALACTHFLRDHSAGAAGAAAAGIPVLVPAQELDSFADAEAEHARRQTFVGYENYWRHFAPVRSVRVADLLHDHARLRLAGLDVEVVPLPGVTLGQVGLAVQLPGVGDVVFCAEAIHSPGRLARVAPLQYGYEDLSGAVAATVSARTLSRRAPCALLPSLGEPILDGVVPALELLVRNLAALCDGRGGAPGWHEAEHLAVLAGPQLEPVGERVHVSRHALATSTFVVTAAGRVLAIDYGHHLAGAAFPLGGRPSPLTRRPLLHSLEGLRELTGRATVDVVVPTHYHDDHVAGIPLLQRCLGTECWAPEPVAWILADPMRSGLPCTWPQPVAVTRRLPVGVTVSLDDVRLHVGPEMSGHTRHATLLGLEVAGTRYAHTGDQYAFAEYERTGRVVPWSRDTVAFQHVYRNGAERDGYRRSAEWLLAWRPDVVLTGHQPPMRTDADFFARIAEFADRYESVHDAAMPLGADDVHLGLDSAGGRLDPYRTLLAEPGGFRVDAVVRNPLPRDALLELVPAGVAGATATLRARAHAEARVTLALRVQQRARRRAFAVELLADGRSFGQVAEGLVTVGDRF